MEYKKLMVYLRGRNFKMTNTIDGLDYEKLYDISRISKKAFLESYSYFTEKEYNQLLKDLPLYNRVIGKLKKNFEGYYISGKRLIHYFNNYKQFEQSKIR